MILGPSLLFCPADRPDRYAKAAAAGDSVILDLEDAVGADNKDDARRSLLASALDPATTIVRVNPVGTAFFADDIARPAAHRLHPGHAPEGGDGRRGVRPRRVRGDRPVREPARGAERARRSPSIRTLSP